MGGFITKKALVRDHFPAINGQSRNVVLKLNADVDEPALVHNIYFVPKVLSLISGEIADKILREFGEFFEVIAATQTYDKLTNTTGFYELKYDESKEQYTPKRKGSNVIKFNRERLKLLSDKERSAVREAKLLQDKAKEVARIAQINAEAMKIAESNSSSN